MTALYDTLGAAETARDELIALGIADSEVFVRSADTEATTGSATGTEDKGFWASLGDLFMPDEDRYAYSEGIRRGGYLLTVRVPDGLEDQVVDVMERSDPIDLDERTETWRSEGWTGGTSATGTTSSSSYTSVPGSSAIGTAGYSEAARTSAYADTAASMGTVGTEATVQLAEEELQVGKRQAGGGRVRVRTYVVERPVEEQVDLHAERVTIERRPVDQEVVSGVAAFQERTIEAVERGEEVVVSKTARVKEEIA
ncbi:YsnF/AvaK domain-containing protein, partial [Geminicoccus harenae]